MSAVAVRQALGRAARAALGAAGVRAEHTAAAAAASSALADASLPTADPVMRPFYDSIARMEVVPASSPKQSSESETAVRHCLPPAACRQLLPSESR